MRIALCPARFEVMRFCIFTVGGQIWPGVALSICMFACGCSDAEPDRAESTGSCRELAKGYVQRYAERRGARAARDLSTSMASHRDPETRDEKTSRLLDSLQPVNAEGRKELQDILKNGLGTFDNSVKSVLDKSRSAREELQERWTERRSKLYINRVCLFWLTWLAASVLVVASLVAVRHVRYQFLLNHRQECRVFGIKVIRARRRFTLFFVPVVVLVLVAAIGTAVFVGERWGRSKSELRREAADTDNAVSRMHEETGDGKRESSAAPTTQSTTPAAVEELAGSWEHTRAQLADLYVESRLHDELTVVLMEDEKQLVWTRNVIVSEIIVCVGLLVLFAGLSRCLKCSFIADANLRAKENKKWCPKCHNEYKEIHTERIYIDPENPTPKNTVIRCAAPWDGKNKCSYEIMEDLLPATKLCFPLVGLPTIGKTVWLAAVYERLNRAVEEKLRTIDRETDVAQKSIGAIIEQLKRGDRKTDTTQTVLPDPTVIEFTDSDPHGESKLLVNLFDYPGEVFWKMVARNSPLRRRMLRADGVLLFLDVTKSFDQNWKKLSRFVEEARQFDLTAPVAICLSRIDLYVDHAGATYSPKLQEFVRNLEELERNYWGPQCKLIELRSDMVLELIRTVWGDVDFERKIREVFDEHRFFPTTSFGFTRDDEPLKPHYILEPLLWLIQKNGFIAFPD